ncbi:Shaggy-like kinase 13 isoform 1 [Hibiscus syriacus]|uniref:Shaggy-like kinase 13 isoform 1 n=1 Tax=Hibiscus syriacus TaxID=106335 RepID=A0A6A2ZL33_HIBSY|nr:Shaggy-like kinase 13 isoform 1 [Hibiscus syriacus]
MSWVNPTNVVAFLTVLLFWFSSFELSCSAREGKQWRQSVAGGSHHRMTASWPNIGSSTASSTSAATSTAMFNVLDHGAKGDGRTDDTKAFQAAWDEACKVEASTVVVPLGSVFLVGPISFSGPNCQPNIAFQLDGKIIAPTSSSAWGGLLQWIEFAKLKGITIKGKGTIDGQGSVWWNDSPTIAEDSTTNETISAELKGMPGTKPTALRFYGSNGVTVTGITIQNSPQTHLKFDDCTSVQVSNFVASSPGDSPNTDGIHLQNSQDVVISATTLACGDDCVSIQTGCSNVNIDNVKCGPGHGISIGGLGKDSTKACVSNITVRDGGSGAVKQVTFSNVQVSEVETPIMIDQFYCDKGHCKNQSSAVQLSGINYVNIRGTYTMQPVHFACSDSIPCSGVSLNTIELKPVQESRHLDGPFCWEAYGELKTTTEPPISCLETQKHAKGNTQSNSESC